MELCAKTIAAHLGGKIEGNPDIKAAGFARIEQAGAGDLCFLANGKYEDYLYTTRAAIAIVSDSFVLKREVTSTIIWVQNAYEAIAKMLALYAAINAVKRSGREYPSRVSLRSKRGKNCYIGAYAYISRGARIGNNVKIFPHVYVGDNVSIGDDAIIYSGVKIYAACHLGKRCIVHSGAVIGADGFGFVPNSDKVYSKIEQIGNVIIGDDVEIGANACIDRATMNSTIVGNGVKLDNLVHLAHNVEVGENTVMAAATAIAGSTKIGRRCMFGGQSGVVPHTIIGDDASIGAQSGVIDNIPDGASVLGYPAIPARQFLKSYAIFKKLYDIQKIIYELKKKTQE